MRDARQPVPYSRGPRHNERTVLTHAEALMRILARERADRAGARGTSPRLPRHPRTERTRTR